MTRQKVNLQQHNESAQIQISQRKSQDQNDQNYIYPYYKKNKSFSIILRGVIILVIIFIFIVGKQLYDLLNVVNNIRLHPQISFFRDHQQNFQRSDKVIQYLPIQNVTHNNQLNWLRKEQQITDQKSQFFQVEKNFWLFQAKHKDKLEEIYYKNVIYYARTSGFTVKIIGKNNYFHYLPQQYSEQVANIIKILSKKQKESKNDDNKKIINKIINQIPLLYVLSMKGGVMLSDYYCLTQDLGWIRHIQRNIHAKRGENIVVPEVFAFYDPLKSSLNKKQNIEVSNEVDKYMSLFPYLTSYFLVAKKQSKFIMSIIHEINRFFVDQNYSTEDLQLDHYQPHLNERFYDYFYLATMRVLQTKQSQLDKQSQNSKYRKIALHHYGIYTINEFIGPRKIWALFDDANPRCYYQILAKSQQQITNEFYGPLRFITRITPHQDINKFLVDSINQSGYPIIQNSFIQKILFPLGNQSFIKERVEKPSVNQKSQPWSALPKIIWVYWGSGIKNAHFIIQICVQNLKRRGQQSGFQVKIVDDNSIKEYIDNETLTKIQTALSNAKVKTFVQSRVDLYRMALLMRYGGIYMDITYFAYTNFDWLVNIGKYRSQFIYNRYGKIPDVLFFFNQQFGSPFNWQEKPEINAKVQEILGYQNNFMAAVKDSRFMKDWFNLLLSLYAFTYDEVRIFFAEKCKLKEFWGSEYFMPMDTLMCTIGLKSQQIKSNKLKGFYDASDYYKIWGMSGTMGIHKMRDRTGFQTHCKLVNSYFFKYSQKYVEGMIGKMYHLSKFFSSFYFFVGRQIIRNKSNFTTQIHPQSIFMKHLYYQNLQQQIVKIDGLSTLKQ